MAFDFGDRRSGFCHREVVTFINEEVLNNGGSPDFYLSFRSRPWNEIEDGLCAILTDPQVPRATKRACAWSALALSARVVARQPEQQARQARWLREQIEGHDDANRALASDLQRVRQERDEVVLQLRRARDDLQKVLYERDMLYWQLLQAERSAQADTLTQDEEQQSETLAAGSQGGQVALSLTGGAQIPSATDVHYQPGPPSPWVQVVQPPKPMPFPAPFPAPYPVAFPYLPPSPLSVLSEGEAVAGVSVPPQLPIGYIYPPGPQSAAVASREEIDSQRAQRSQSEGEGPVRPPGLAPPIDRRSQVQEDSAVRPRFRNLSEHSLDQGDSRKQQPLVQMAKLPKGKKDFESQQE
ncbi:PREDICTED: testis-expressed sequence 13B protein-like [Propithecus coquereli]|uniref:testis-expressed sequence 13B protein-like n=1 Tax=Propithecus coquereli TaxID=379532 RepID=UPI00063F805F|nr:PREDICTED: testis-expressed sequence 13B protein-like [Propithecus coquereli]